MSRRKRERRPGPNIRKRSNMLDKGYAVVCSLSLMQGSLT